jgi:glucose-6-phosphate isomerase
VSFYASLVNINAYHQPGVEAGKKAAALILALQERLETLLSDGKERSLLELQQALGTDSPEPLFWILRHLCANPRGYQVSGDWGQPAAMRFAKV